VIEIGAALKALGEKPKRSIVFMTVLRRGDRRPMAARYYTSHPIFPLAKDRGGRETWEQLGAAPTIAKGPKPLQFNLNRVSITPISRRRLGAGQAGRTNIQVIKHEKE